MEYKNIFKNLFIVFFIILIFIYLFNRELELEFGSIIFKLISGNSYYQYESYIYSITTSIFFILKVSISIVIVLCIIGYFKNYKLYNFNYKQNLIRNFFLTEVSKNVNIFSIIIILLYSIMVIFGVTHHEPWLNEAQAWLIARDLSVTDIIKQMGYEGSPSLWHFILVPFAKSGVPYISASIIHAIIAIICVAIFIIYSPFSVITKVLFVFSYYMAYEYAVIARNYNITILCSFLIILYYKKRFVSPVLYGILVFFLFNTNIHSFFMAGSLMCLYIYEVYKKERFIKHYVCILIMAAGGVTAFLQVIPEEDCFIPLSRFVPANSGLFSSFYSSGFITGIYDAFFNGLPSLSFIKLLVLSLVMLFLIICFFIRKPYILFLFLCSYMWLCYIFTFKNPGALRHHGLMLIFLIFSIWIGDFYKESFLCDNEKCLSQKFFDISQKILFIMLNIGLLCSCVYNVYFYCRDYKFNFSSSKEVAQFILTNHYDRYTLVCYGDISTAPILPYLPESKVWYVARRGTGTFVIWNMFAYKSVSLKEDEIIKIVKGNFSDLSHVLLILNIPLSNQESSGFKLIYHSNPAFGLEAAAYERYWIYKAFK